MKPNRIFYESGFSLIEVSISLLISTIVVAGALGLIQEMRKTTLGQEAVAEFRDTTSEIRWTLRDRRTCELNFRGVRQTPTEPQGSAIATIDRYDAAGVVSANLAKAGKKGMLNFSKITLMPKHTINPSLVISEVLLEGRGAIQLQPSKINLLVKIESNRVETCVEIGGAGEISEADVCKMVGTEFDGVAKRCKPPEIIRCGATSPDQVLRCPAGWTSTPGEWGRCAWKQPYCGDPEGEVIAGIIGATTQNCYPEGWCCTLIPKMGLENESGEDACTAEYSPLLPNPIAHGTWHEILCKRAGANAGGTSEAIPAGCYL